MDRLLDFDHRTMRFAVRLPEDAAIKTYQTGELIKEKAAALFGNSSKADVSGFNYLAGGFLDEFFTAMKT